MEAEAAVENPAAPAAGVAGGMDAAPAVKAEPGTETLQESAAAAPAPVDAADTIAGAASDAVKTEDAPPEGAEEDEPGLPPLPSTVQLLQESCGWTVSGRIEVRRQLFAQCSGQRPLACRRWCVHLLRRE